MKKTRYFLGAIVFVFAFASAFAFKTASAVEKPAIINALGACEEVEATCNGTAITCKLNGKTVYDLNQATTCTVELEMPN